MLLFLSHCTTNDALFSAFFYISGILRLNINTKIKAEKTKNKTAKYKRHTLCMCVLMWVFGVRSWVYLISAYLQPIQNAIVLHRSSTLPAQAIPKAVSYCCCFHHIHDKCAPKNCLFCFSTFFSLWPKLIPFRMTANIHSDMHTTHSNVLVYTIFFVVFFLQFTGDKWTEKIIFVLHSHAQFSYSKFAMWYPIRNWFQYKIKPLNIR